MINLEKYLQGSLDIIQNQEKISLKIEKSQSEVYLIRWENKRDWWLQATIQSERGYIAVTSSHGDYQYRWLNPGKAFKEFLIDLDNNYLMSKFGQMTCFNSDETIKSLKRWIFDARKQKDISVEEAREAYDFVIKNLDTTNEYLYYNSLENCPIITEKIFGYNASVIPCYKDYEPSLKAFVENLWPAFVAVLKKEKQNSLNLKD